MGTTFWIEPFAGTLVVGAGAVALGILFALWSSIRSPSRMDDVGLDIVRSNVTKEPAVTEKCCPEPLPPYFCLVHENLVPEDKSDPNFRWWTKQIPPAPDHWS